MAIHETEERVRALVDKIRALPPERAAEVEDFVDFLAERDDRQLTQAASRLSESAFDGVWGDAEDSAYDSL